MATFAAVCAASGIAVDPTRAFPICKAWHNKAQGTTGSGGDVAAALIGGLACLEGERIDRVSWVPPLAVAFHPASASTPQFISNTKRLKAAAPAELLRTHQWMELFWHRRAQLARDMRCLVFGHALWDQLRAPFVGLTAKAVVLEVEGAWLARPLALQLADVDCRLAEIFSRPGAYARPRDFQPLPLLGIPGVVAENSDPSYYGDLRQFRPARSALR